jgi:hypothetical protein
MDIRTIIIILVILFLLGGGGWLDGHVSRRGRELMANDELWDRR